MSLDTNNHVISRLAPTISGLFQQTPLSYFAYFRCKEDGTWEYFISNAEMLKLFCKHHLMENIPLVLSAGYQRPGRYLVNSDPKAYASEIKYLQLYRMLNLDHKYVIIDGKNLPHGRAIDYFTFAGLKSDFYTNYYYLNHHDVLQKFVNDFTRQLAFNQIPLTAGPSTISHIAKKALFNNMFNEMPSLYNTRRILSSANLLTKREYDIIRLLIDGRSTKETANILNLSIRTVENHFQNMRKKLNCKSKTQLLQRLSFDRDTLFSSMPSN